MDYSTECPHNYSKNVCVLKPPQKQESHVKANLEVTSSQFSLIHFKVCPLKAENKKTKTKAVTASRHCRHSLPKHTDKQLHVH